MDDIVNTIQLQYWVKKNTAAVLAMIEDLRTDRDEGLDLALQQQQVVRKNQDLKEALVNTNKIMNKAKAKAKSLEA